MKFYFNKLYPKAPEECPSCHSRAWTFLSTNGHHRRWKCDGCRFIAAEPDPEGKRHAPRSIQELETGNLSLDFDHSSHGRCATCQ